MFPDERQDALMKLPALKGPALAIFVALLIAGCPLTREEMILYTGWEKDALTRGIKRLKTLGAVIDRGRYKGWELAPNWQQLPLPILYTDDNGRAEKTPSRAEKTPSRAEKTLSPVTRSTLLTTTTTLNKQKAVVVSNVGAGACGVKSEKTPSPVDNSIKTWLEKGGVGTDTPQMQALLQMQLDESFVKAHVLERLAQVEAGATSFGVGLLIVKLKAGDRAPRMRCEGCLKVERECRCGGGHIPDEYKDIIQR